MFLENVMPLTDKGKENKILFQIMESQKHTAQVVIR